MKRTRFLLLTVLMICSNWAWAFRPCDFEVDGIYYNIIGENEVTVTTKYNMEDGEYPDSWAPQEHPEGWQNYYIEEYTYGGMPLWVLQPYKNYTGDVYIPSSVTYESKTYRVTTISSNVFYNCDITSITIPNSVTKIENSLFAGCEKLTSINVAEDNPIYDSRNGCNAIIETASNTLISGCRNTTIDNTITTIGTSAFYNVTIDNFTALPTSVYFIGNSAFYNSQSDSFLIIPNSVKEIGYKAFEGTRYKIINLSSSSISRMQNSNLYNCPNGEIIDDLIFDRNSSGNVLVFYLGNDSNITLPENYKGENYSIGEEAFYNCSSLTSITIPNSVTSIGEEAFYNCSSLKTVFNFSNLGFSKGSTYHGYIAYYADKVYNFHNGEILGDFVFYQNSNRYVLGLYLGKDSNVTLPENYKGENYSIGDEAFYGCSSLTSINIPNSVTSIGEKAFYKCSSLTSITIPNSVTSIGKEAFYGCSSLKTIINFSKLEFRTGYTDYGYINALVYNLPNGEILGDFAFYKNSNRYVLGLYLGNDSNITLPENYKGENYSIGDYAFFCCSSLTSINIPNSVTSIGDYAFNSCRSLTSITIPNSVTSIGDEAFYNCSSLKTVINCSNLRFSKGSTYYGYIAYYADKVYNLHGAENVEFVDDFIFYSDSNGYVLGLYLGKDSNITLPENYKGENYSIAKKAFYYCSSLTSITIPNSVTSIGEEAFSGCSSLTSITIPNSVTSIENYAFDGCSSLTSINIPNSVTSIGKCAFRDCSSLTSINIHNSVTSIGNNAFEGCHSVIELCINGEKFPTFSDLPSVEKIILGENIKEAAEDAFNNYPVLNTLEFHCKRIYDWNFGTSRITDIIIGEEVAVIFGGAFEEVETLERLKVEAMVPPIADDNTFSKLQYRMLEVSVPESAIEDYKADEVWKKFSSIKGYVPTDIEGAITETNQEINISFNANGLSFDNAEGMPVSVYTSAGQLVMHHTNYNNEILRLPKGIYVIRVGNTAKKVVMK